MSRLGQTSLEPLEPYDGKLSCTVLRGESPRKGADLLDVPPNGGKLQTISTNIKLSTMSKEINARKYIKEYENDKVVARYIFPLTLEKYLKDQTETYIECLHEDDMPYDGYRELRIKPLGENPAEDITKRVCSWALMIKTPYYYLLYQAFQKDDWQAVNDAQYQYAKQ